MKRVIMLLLVSLTVSLGLRAQVNLIFDTDMGNDVDDSMALAMIHSLERRDACRLLAVTSSKDHIKSVAFIDALNTFYRRPNVPIGAVRNGVTPDLGRYLGLIEEKNSAGQWKYPHDLTSGSDAPDAVTLIRKTLSAQPNKSVKIVQVGFFTNMAQLLDSGSDEHSPLDGPALITKKVTELVVMAGAFQTIRFNTRHLEYNVRKDVQASQKVAKEWPTPIVWSGFEVGIAAAYPWQSIEQDFAYTDDHIVREAYLSYVPEKPHDRPTWDLTAVLYAVHPKRGYFDLSVHGEVVIGSDGGTDFKPTEKGRDRYLLMDDLQAGRVREAFVQLVSEAPPVSR